MKVGDLVRAKERHLYGARLGIIVRLLGDWHGIPGQVVRWSDGHTMRVNFPLEVISEAHI